MESKPKIFGKKEIMALMALIILFISIIVISIFVPDETPEMIKNEFQRQGYDVEGIEFTKDERFSDLFYQSSEPIFYEGNHVSFWLFKKNYMGSPYLNYYTVELFPILCQ